MTEAIDVSLYVRTPILNVGNGIALARRLIAAMPANASPSVRKAARRMRQSAAALQEAWAARIGRERMADPRPADQAMDNAISTLHGRLANYAALPSSTSRNRMRAQELLEELFPNGLSFLKLSYSEEWAEIGTLLKRIDDGGLAKDLDRLCGAEFLETVRAQFAAYGDALGVTRRNGDKEVLVSEPLRTLSRAIGAYALQVLAAIDEADAAGQAALRAALKPFDEVRASASRRRGQVGNGTELGSNGAGDAEPGAPLPPVPEGPTD